MSDDFRLSFPLLACFCSSKYVRLCIPVSLLIHLHPLLTRPYSIFLLRSCSLFVINTISQRPRFVFLLLFSSNNKFITTLSSYTLYDNRSLPDLQTFLLILLYFRFPFVFSVRFIAHRRHVQYLIHYYDPFSAACCVHSMARCLTISMPSSSPSRFSNSSHFLKKAFAL